MKLLVVIIGVSFGIGEVIVCCFSEVGYLLLLVVCCVECLEVLNLFNILCEKVDVMEVVILVVVIVKVEVLYGFVDLLVNNAGVMLFG